MYSIKHIFQKKEKAKEKNNPSLFNAKMDLKVIQNT